MSDRFYTNAQMIGKYFYVRGVENNRRVEYKKEYQPKLYIKSNTKTQFKTLEGEYLKEVQPGNAKDCKGFMAKYEDVENFNIYGNERFLYQFISDEFANDVDYNLKDIVIYFIDIEVSCDNGFPSVDECTEEILLITIQDYSTKKITTWGVKPYNCTLEKELKEKYVESELNYIQCDDEKHLLLSFTAFWKKQYPDIVSGWNCLPFNSSVWGVDKIKKICQLNVNDNLYDSEVKTIFPKSNKVGYIQTLANGAKITSSIDHIFPYVLCDGLNYTKLKLGGKSKSYYSELSVGEAIKEKNEKFLYVQLRSNCNVNNPNYSLDQCYLLGLIYTDGSCKSKERIMDGATVYQSDLDMIKNIKNNLLSESSIVGPYKNCYSIHVPYCKINNFDLIYDENNKKRLNLELLSTLSEEQFYAFLSGALDGDGYVSGNSFGICNFNNDIDTLYELCLWNGIFATINTKRTHLRFIEIDFDKLTLKKNKRWDNLNIRVLKRESSELASKISFKKCQGGYLVRVCDISETNETEMMDIETSTHFFVSGGVKTHNCHMYDIPYICGRLDMVLGDKNCLSPWNYVYETEEWANNRNNKVYNIQGVSTLDYMVLYKKYILKPRESYSLNYIAEVELKQTKLDHSEYSTFKDFYTNGWNKYVDYNIVDTVLVSKLEEKLKLIELVINLAYDAKVNYSDVLFQVRTWDMIIYNYLKKFNIIIPPKQKVDKADKYPGGYVKEPIPGVYDYVVNYDLNSLYPHLIMQYNISPETLVERADISKRISKLIEQSNIDQTLELKQKIDDYNLILKIIDQVTIDKLVHKTIDLDILKKYDLTIAPNGSLYRTDMVGFLPTIMKTMYDERVKYKQRMIEAKKELKLIDAEMKRRDLL